MLSVCACMCTHVHAIALHRQYSASILQLLILHVCSHRIHCVLPSKLLLMNLQSNFLHWKKTYNTFKGFMCIWGRSLRIKSCFHPGIPNITRMSRGKVKTSCPMYPAYLRPLLQIPGTKSKNDFPSVFFRAQTLPTRVSWAGNLSDGYLGEASPLFTDWEWCQQDKWGTVFLTARRKAEIEATSSS